jgi:hypothetical protein
VIKVKTLALEKKALPLRGNIERTLRTKLARFEWKVCCNRLEELVSAHVLIVCLSNRGVQEQTIYFLSPRLYKRVCC